MIVLRIMSALQRLQRDEAGFSLTEMMAVLAILLTVVGVVTTLMVSAIKSEVDLTERTKAQQETRLALERMRRDVHCASTTSLMADTPASLVTLTMPLGCPSAAGLTPLVASPTFGNVTWCTSGSASRWALYRIPDFTTCTTAAAGARREADYLTQPNLFTLKTQVNKLARLCAVFPVDTDPTDASRAYALKDFLVLRNSIRGGSGTQAC